MSTYRLASRHATFGRAGAFGLGADLLNPCFGDFRPIRAAIRDSDVANLAPAEDDFEAEEGAVVLRYHKARERRPELARKKRAQVLAATGKLECEVCTFDFGARYGEHGEGFMEVHHRTPVSELAAGAKTRLSDLALVCANCHRMLHRGGLLSLQALRTRSPAVMAALSGRFSGLMLRS